MKSCQDLMNRFVFRRLGRWLAGFLDVSPSVVSFFAFVFGLLACYSIFVGEFVLGGLFVFVSHLLDKTDGEVARRFNRTSLRGDFLDDTFDRILDNCFVLFLAMVTYNYFYGCLSLIAVNMTFIIGMSDKKADDSFTSVEQTMLSGIPSWLILGRGVRNTIIILSLLIRMPIFPLLFFASVQNLYWMVGSIYVYVRK